MEEIKCGFVGIASDDTVYIIQNADTVQRALRIMAESLIEWGWKIIIDPRNRVIQASRPLSEDITVTVKASEIIGAL